MAEEGVQASVGPPILPDFMRPTYSNTVNVSFTPHDFRMVFSLLAVPFNPPEGAEQGSPIQLHPQAVADVLIPASVMHAFIGALNEAFGHYLNQFGAPGLDPEGPAREG